MNGMQLKEHGQQLALFTAGQLWTNQTLNNLRTFCDMRKKRGEPIFKFEEFRAEVESHGWPAPATHKVWGSIPRIAVTMGLIEWTGQHVPAQSKKTHGHFVKTWRAI